MKTLIALTLSLGLLVAFAPPAHAAEQLLVVVHARNPTKKLAKAELRAMLVGNKAFWHGVVPVKVVVRPPSTDAGKALFADVLGMDAGQFSAQWTSRQLAGQGVAPEAIADAAAAMAKASASPGGITVVTKAESANLPAGVKLIPLD